jgi:hypothetical protein
MFDIIILEHSMDGTMAAHLTVRQQWRAGTRSAGCPLRARPVTKYRNILNLIFTE